MIFASLFRALILHGCFIKFGRIFTSFFMYCWWFSWSYTHLAKPSKSMTLTVLLRGLASRKLMIFHDFRDMFRCSFHLDFWRYFASILASCSTTFGIKNNAFSTPIFYWFFNVFFIVFDTLKRSFWAPFGTLKVIKKTWCSQVCFLTWFLTPNGSIWGAFGCL